MNDRGSTSGWVMDVYLRRFVHTGSWTHQTFCRMGTRVFFPGDKAVGAWSWPHTHI